MIDHSFKNWLLVKEQGITPGITDKAMSSPEAEDAAIDAIKKGIDPVQATRAAIIDDIKSQKVSLADIAKGGESKAMKKQMKKKMKAR